MKEPCPYCGQRVKPREGPYGEKICPECGGSWYEGGWGAEATVPAP
ncbi:MAG: hypothetical protein NXY59_08185 [Aigarchaeota archaeon]|nr:hypothetical protein [Candidatus Pelearchaeum maunauluense]